MTGSGIDVAGSIEVCHATPQLQSSGIALQRLKRCTPATGVPQMQGRT